MDMHIPLTPTSMCVYKTDRMHYTNPVLSATTGEFTSLIILMLCFFNTSLRSIKLIDQISIPLIKFNDMTKILKQRETLYEQWASTTNTIIA